MRNLFNLWKNRPYLTYSGMGGVVLKRLAINLWTVILLLILFLCGATVSDSKFPMEFLMKTKELCLLLKDILAASLYYIKKFVSEVNLPYNWG